MHFGDDTNFVQNNIDGIVSALNSSINDIESVLVFVSGDLSFSGKESQFKSVELFFNKLKKAIIHRYNIKEVKFYVVPGNHDVDYSVGVGDIKREGLERINKENLFDAEIPNEQAKLENFYKFSNLYYCFTNKNLLHKKVLSYGDKKIQLNLINTAVYSSLEEDKAFHHLRQIELDRLKEHTDCDFVFSVMHHPCSWFNSQVTDAIEDALYHNSDLIFVGHKHYETTRKVTDCMYSVDILAGGMLSNKGNWNSSEFHVCILDLDNRLIKSSKYQWEKAENIYLEKDSQTICLSKDRVNPLGLTVRSKYLKESINQDSFMISDSFLNYFVFPLLEEHKDDLKGKSGHDIDNIESFISKLFADKKIIIYGINDSGKTSLLRALFCELVSKKIVVYINGSEVDSNFETAIKNSFVDIYGAESAKYEQFKQTEASNLVAIIDDFDAIKENNKETFIDYVNERFGYILCSCQQDIDLSIESRIRKAHDRKDYTIYRIEPFYTDKRRELVTKVVNIYGNDGQNKENIIEVLCDSLSKQKTLYNWSPSFIIQFTKYFYNNIGESSQKDGDVFSRVFESNLTSLIKPYANKLLTVDKIFMILDKIAYSVIKHKEYPISNTRVCSIIDEYNSKYDETVNTFDFLNTLVKSQVMKSLDNGFIFYERSYLAYFTAREIRRLINMGDYYDIKTVMKNSYMNINADILLFVTFITDNLKIIRMLMDLVDQSTEKWEEFSLKPINIPYMIQPANVIIKPVDEGDREKEEKELIEAEKEQTKLISVSNDSSIFDGESEDPAFIQELIRATALMITLARALPSFEHLMEKEDKERCVELLYKLPLRLFNYWAKEVDDSSSVLVQLIKYFHEREYRKEKPNFKPMTDNEALELLRWESSSLLLELMNASFTYSTRENTGRYFDQFSYKSADTYEIEHLMSIQNRDCVSVFMSESISLYEAKNEELTKHLLQRAVRKYMITSKKIQYPDIQKLNSKLFSNRLAFSQILLEKNKNKKKY